MTDIQAIADIQLNSIEDGCRQLARILELDVPVSHEVLISAVQSDEYARNLLICRRTPAFLNTLLSNPIRPQLQAQDRDRGAFELMKQASHALARWGAVGFSVVDDEVLKRRLRACLACPNLRTSSTATVYKLMKTQASCALCGCDVEKKARMSSEHCPGEDPEIQGRNRWGQLLRTT
ncbi:MULTISPECIES: hypothetical protein [Burkholderiaceae]|uniref:hypothetical protein n=1 Tax=Burkholderiaceae TaxID=119060 RepID=UPI00095AE09C|nr:MULTISPECIES: hypothetical protein [Burkholderiaceae]MCF2133790.1 hypothetical protein [Mycetohabitans sp. B3]MCG1038844.1 hypothetical protein [Mycetohabitans sp. B7]SIT68541.1 hypothetical protein SAMN04487769_1341 [Burkholderia sp. b14]